MRVLHCITTLNLGGAQVMLKRYLAATAGVDGERHAVVSLTGPGPIGAEIGALGVPVRSLGQTRGRPTPAALLRLRRLIASERPDIVYGWMYHGNLAASLARATLGTDVPVVWGIHHSLQDIRREARLTRAVIRATALLSPRVAAIAYCSRVSAAQHERYGYASGRRTIIPNGIDTDSFRPCEDARRRLTALGVPEGRFVLGNFARDHPMKNHVALVRATAALAERGHDVHALIAGEGQLSGAAAREARSLGLRNRVTLLEARDDVAALVPGLDLFVLSSAWGEAFPLSVGEAMAAGVPVVATDVGDCDWLVGDTGRIVRPGNTHALVEAIEGLIGESRAARRTRGLRARSRVAELFSMERYVAAHRDVFAGLVAA